MSTTAVAVWAGAIDRLVPIGHARYLAANIPGAELHIVPDRGHALDDYPDLRVARQCMTVDTRRLDPIE